MTTRFGRGAGVLRLGAAVVVTAGLVGAASSVDLPTLDLTGAQPATSSPAGTAPVDRAVLACPGPETIGVKDSDETGTAAAPAQISAASAPDAVLDGVASSSATGRLSADLLPGPHLLDRSGPSSGSADAVGHTEAAAAVALTGSGAYGRGLVGSQWTVVSSGDLRGLSSTACTAGADETWLVGGGTGAGRRGRIVLANAAPNPVDVDVEVLGADGPVARSAGSGVAVPARSRVVLLLDALAPGVEKPVVHVSATGGTVSATLHDSILQGTTPRGVDDVQPAAQAARRTLVPGLVVQGGAGLRLASTSGAEAVAQVRLLGPQGPVDVPGGGVVRVPSHSTRDLALTGVAAGTYTAEVTSDAPVVAGGFVQRAAPRASDFAWLASVVATDRPVGVAGVPVGPVSTSVLVLSAPDRDVHAEWVLVRAGAADATGRISPGTVERHTVDVAAGTTQQVALTDASSVWVHQPGTEQAPLVAARVSTRSDPLGQMVTGGPLTVAELTVPRPAVAPAP